MREKFRHTSNFGAGPSDAGNFNTPQTVKRCGLFRTRTKAHKRSRRPTAHSQASRRDEQADCRQQHNNTRPPSPETRHRGQEVPRIAHKKIVGENVGNKLKNDIFRTKLSPYEIRPSPCGCSAATLATKAMAMDTRFNRSSRPTPPPPKQQRRRRFRSSRRGGGTGGGSDGGFSPRAAWGSRARKPGSAGAGGLA